MSNGTGVPFKTWVCKSEYIYNLAAPYPPWNSTVHPTKRKLLKVNKHCIILMLNQLQAHCLHWCPLFWHTVLEQVRLSVLLCRSCLLFHMRKHMTWRSTIIFSICPSRGKQLELNKKGSWQQSKGALIFIGQRDRGRGVENGKALRERSYNCQAH